jgi:hypothetical protein
MLFLIEKRKEEQTMKEKQIEEMAKILRKEANKRQCFLFGASNHLSEALYNAGYRKQREGEWIWTENGDEDYEQFWICSVCNEKSYIETKFCTNCGAKMKGEQDGTGSIV